MANPTAVVIGSGVVGLSTAIMLQDHLHIPVQIVAQRLPSDATKSTEITSLWAGANWWSFASFDDHLQQSLEAFTYFKFKELARDSPEAGIMTLPLEAWYTTHPDVNKQKPWFSHVVDNVYFIVIIIMG